MSADGYTTDAATRHQFYVQRFGSGLAGKAAKFVRKAIRRAKEAVNEGLSQYATARYNRQIETLRSDLNAIYGELSQQQKLDLGEFAQYEFTFNSKLLGQIVKASVRLAEPSAEMIAAAVLADPLELAVGRGRQVIDITGALAQFGSKKTADILSEIAIGSSLGETQKEIVRRLTSLGVSHEDQVGSLVRTMTNHVASSARAETLKQNDDILQGHRWISTLDSRTSNICRARDRKVYPLDGPKPPAHWGCRSSIVPVLKPEYQREIPGSTRPSKGPDGVEQVSSSTSYGDWLARQPATFQKEVLGPARYKLFSKGDLSIDRFVDDNGKQYTLDQLKDLEPHAFELAGLE